MIVAQLRGYTKEPKNYKVTVPEPWVEALDDLRDALELVDVLGDDGYCYWVGAATRTSAIVGLKKITF